MKIRCINFQYIYIYIYIYSDASKSKMDGSNYGYPTVHIRKETKIDALY